MNKSILFLIIGICVLLVAIVMVVKFKTAESFKIDDIEKISITDLDNREEKLVDILDKDESSYLLVFQLNDCYSCVYKGLEELKSLRKAGKVSLAVIVEDYIEEVKAWSSAHEYPDCLMLKRIDFYEKIKCPSTPVLVRIAKGKVKNYKYIVAN